MSKPTNPENEALRKRAAEVGVTLTIPSSSEYHASKYGWTKTFSNRGDLKDWLARFGGPGKSESPSKARGT